MTRLLLTLAVGLASSGLAGPALAQACTTSWASATDGDWSDASKWTSGVPGETSTACIQAAGTYTVTLDQNQALAGLHVGGASGTQTLLLDRLVTSLGNGRIGPNGRVETREGAPCGACAGFPLVTGTLTLEGVIETVGSGMLAQGGTLDVAAGGRLVLDTSVRAIAIGQGRGAGASVLRVRGRVVVDLGGGTPKTPSVKGFMDVDGGAVEVQGGRFYVNSEGTLRNATFDVAEGAELYLRKGEGRSGIYVVEGTMRGDVRGLLQFQNGELQTGAEEARLDVGGEGLTLSSSLKVQGVGSAFVNDGIVQVRANPTFFGALRNEGAVRVVGVALNLYEAAVLHNEAGATIELIDQGSFGAADRTGRVENSGQIIVRVKERTSGRSSFGKRVVSEAGSEIRVMAPAELYLEDTDPHLVRAGVTLSGSGLMRVPSATFEVEGTVSPGTPEAPIDTLRFDRQLLFPYVAGDPQMIVDLDAAGLSDRIEIESASAVRAIGRLVVRLRPGYVPQAGDRFTLIAAQPFEILGRFDEIVVEGEAGGVTFDAQTNVDRSELHLLVLGPVAGEGAPAGEIALTAGPNPARGAVTVAWTLAAAAPVDLRVFDALGREVALLAAEPGASPGAYERSWDASRLAPGVYAVRLQAGDEVRVQRLTVVR